jgi:hypothetical protein
VIAFWFLLVIETWVSPVVTAVGVAAGSAIVVALGLGSLGVQILGGVFGGRLTGRGSAPGRGLGWFVIATATVVGGAAGVGAALLGAAIAVFVAIR